MIIMKKFMNAILVLVLVIGVVLGVGGCTKRDKNKSTDSTQAVTTEAATAATTEAKNTKDNKSDSDDSDKKKVKDNTVKTDSETVKADTVKTGKTEDDSEKEPATQAPATTEAPTTQAPAPSTQAPTTQAPRTEEPTTAHQHTWKTVIDKDEWDEPIYEEQDVYEDHYTWPDGSYADELADGCAKQRWCMLHCTRCNPGCSDPDPAGRCAFRIAESHPVWVGTNKVQVGTKHHDAVTHQECSTCGARK